MLKSREEYQKEYYQRNKDRLLLSAKKYRDSHKDLTKIYQKEYRKNNKDRRLEYLREYYAKNSETIKRKDVERYKKNREIVLQRTSRYYQNHKAQVNEYIKNRLRKDIQFRLKFNLRNRTRRAIAGGYKTGSSVHDLGCSIPELKAYIESLFKVGMDWSNWGMYGWHLDHKTPLDSFDLTNREEFLRACHYTNLQPLWAKENIQKSNKPSDICATNR